MSSSGAGANTATRAPAADSSSAFQVAAAVPPATTARLPSSAKNAGNRAKAANAAGANFSGCAGHPDILGIHQQMEFSLAACNRRPSN